MNCAQNIYKNKNFDGFDDLECGDLENLTEEIGQNSKKLTIEDLTKEEAERLYYEKHLSFRAIATFFGAQKDSDRKRVLKKCNEWQIKKRAKCEEKIFYIPKEELENFYFNENKSFQDIAEIKQTGTKAIRNAFRRYGLKVKPKTNYGQKLINNSIKNEDIIKLYFDEKLSLKEVANKLKISVSMVQQRLKKCQLERRTCSDYALYERTLNDYIRKSQKNLDLKKEILKRDRFQCVQCGSVKKLQIDHIEPLSWILAKNKIKTFSEALVCEEIWDSHNLRVLCEQCHTRTDTWGPKAIKYVNNKARTLNTNG